MVGSVIFDPPGCGFKVTLSWETKNAFAVYEKTLLDAVEKDECLPGKGTAWRTLMDYTIISQINNEGFGNPGWLYLGQKALTVGLPELRPSNLRELT